MLVDNPKLTSVHHEDPATGVHRPVTQTSPLLPAVLLMPPYSLGPTSAQLRWELLARPGVSVPLSGASAAGLIGAGGGGGGNQQRTVQDGFSISYRPLSASERGTDNTTHKSYSWLHDRLRGKSYGTGAVVVLPMLTRWRVTVAVSVINTSCRFGSCKNSSAVRPL